MVRFDPNSRNNIGTSNRNLPVANRANTTTQIGDLLRGQMSETRSGGYRRV